MLRLHFTAEDLLDTAFLSVPAPLVETTLAVLQLRSHPRATAGARWGREARSPLPREVLPLLELVVPAVGSPSFFDQVPGELDHAIELVRAEPDYWVRAEVERVAAGRPSLFVRAVADRDAEAWDIVERAVRAAHAALVQPWAAQLEATFRSDFSYRAMMTTTMGLKSTLATLCAGSRWCGSTWEIDRPGFADADVHLQGRGLRLLPTASWSGPPLRSNVDGHMVLIYPALASSVPSDTDALATLLGRTRAAVLRALAQQRNTSQLAADLRISLAAASEHTAALRAAGLVHTERVGKAVRHTCTALGHELLATTPAR